MSKVILKRTPQADVPALSDVSKQTLFIDDADGKFKKKTSEGVFPLEPSEGLSINPLTEQVAPLKIGDYVPFYSESASGNKKISAAYLNFKNVDAIDHLESDFVINNGGLTVTVSGTGASGQAGTYGVDGLGKARGVFQVDTGTTLTGRSTLGSGSSNPLFFGAGDLYRLGYRLAPELLSDDTNTFAVRVGFGTNFGNAGLPTNFVGFTYIHNDNGGKWRFSARVDGAFTDSLDTGVICTVEYVKMEIVWNDAGANGYINGVLVGTIAPANLPLGASRTFGFGAQIEKTIGTTQRNMSMDWFYYNYATSVVR